jgi:hypothetical protein
MATPYVKQTWIDNNGANPLSAARLGVIETGIFDAHYRPSAAVYNSAAQSIPNTTLTVVTFNTELYDTDNMHSTVSNTGRLVAPVAGKYHIAARIGFVTNATGGRQGLLRVNGVTNIDQDIDFGPTAAGACYLLLATDYLMAAADYVEVTVVQTSGGALNTSSGFSDTHFSMHLASY